jgi:hypothetical protein
MKKIFSLLCMAILIATVCGATATAQNSKTSYIVVRTGDGEVASFDPGALESQYIQENNWVFELKNGQRFFYPLNDVQPFTTEVRNSGTGTGIEPVAAAAAWSVYDDGNGLTIVNPCGIAYSSDSGY